MMVMTSSTAIRHEYPREIAHGLMFHHLHNGRHPRSQGSISQDDFERILAFVGIDRILAPGAWLEKLDANQLGEEDLCLTFDDALLCQFEIALPVLEKYRLKAFWFIYSCVFEGQAAKFEVYRAFRSRCFQNIDDFYQLFFQKVFNSDFASMVSAVLEEMEITRQRQHFPFYSVNDVKFRLIRDRALSRDEYERIMDEMIIEHGLTEEELARDLWMSDEHLRYLASQGHEVGLHSYSHPMVLADLPVDDQWQEYTRNYQHIRRVCGRSPLAMSHPANSYNDDTITILTRLGIRCGFRSNMFPRREGEGLNPSRFEIARQDHANILRMLGR